MNNHVDLQAMAKQIMMEHGFEPDFPDAAKQQMARIPTNPPLTASNGIRDLRGLLWSSIDNDTSRDLDQIEVVEKLANGDVKVMVGIADVDAFVPKSSPIDDHAAKETTTVYTGVCNFPMLPEALSTGASSLLENEDRLSMVIEFVAAADGTVNSGTVYPALVRNKAQLTYSAVGAWLEGTATAPPKVAGSADLQSQLKLQNQVAQALKTQRFQHGALNIDTNEVHPILLNNQVVDVAVERDKPGVALWRRLGQLVDYRGVRRELTHQGQQRGGPGQLSALVWRTERYQRVYVAIASEALHVIPRDQATKAVPDDVDSFVTGVR